MEEGGLSDDGNSVSPKYQVVIPRASGSRLEQGLGVDLTSVTAMAAARISHVTRLPLADSIIMATAREHDAIPVDSGCGLRRHGEGQIRGDPFTMGGACSDLYILPYTYIDRLLP